MLRSMLHRPTILIGAVLAFATGAAQAQRAPLALVGLPAVALSTSPDPGTELQRGRGSTGGSRGSVGSSRGSTGGSRGSVGASRGSSGGSRGSIGPSRSSSRSSISPSRASSRSIGSQRGGVTPSRGSVGPQRGSATPSRGSVTPSRPARTVTPSPAPSRTVQPSRAGRSATPAPAPNYGGTTADTGRASRSVTPSYDSARSWQPAPSNPGSPTPVRDGSPSSVSGGRSSNGFGTHDLPRTGSTNPVRDTSPLRTTRESSTPSVVEIRTRFRPRSTVPRLSGSGTDATPSARTRRSIDPARVSDLSRVTVRTAPVTRESILDRYRNPERDPATRMQPSARSLNTPKGPSAGRASLDPATTRGRPASDGSRASDRTRRDVATPGATRTRRESPSTGATRTRESVAAATRRVNADRAQRAEREKRELTRLDILAERDPATARRFANAGAAVSAAADTGIRVAVDTATRAAGLRPVTRVGPREGRGGTVAGTTGARSGSYPGYGYGGGYGKGSCYYDYDPCYWWYGGFSYACGGWGWGSWWYGLGWCYKNWCFGWSYSPWCSYYNPWYRPWYYPSYGYGYCYAYPPVVYTSVIYDSYGSNAGGSVVIYEPEEVVIQDDGAAYGEGLVEVPAEAAPLQPAQPAGAGNQEALSRAAAHYLDLGDRAFREGRFGDAVHYYAKSIEFAPDEGVLYLILSDALFATGDYHYAAFALRKALEYDTSLVENILDKHTFYEDPVEFDRQLATLELYLKDHFLDEDARLVLAANYLFGNRPAAAVDLLQEPLSAPLKEDAAARLILEAAKAIQYGGK